MGQATTSASMLYTASTLKNRNVLNTRGEVLGEIEDLVIDSSRGCVAYAVMSYSTGFLNMSHKLFAVPWQALRVDEAHRDFVLDVDKDRLRDSPGFDRDSWPAEPDPTFASTVDEYYGYQGRSYDESVGEGHSGYGEGQDRGYGDRGRDERVGQDRDRDVTPGAGSHRG